MAIFIDTGKIEEIKKYYEMGIIRGVTTNPTILVKDGVTGGMEGVKKRSIEIANLIHPLPLSVEVTSNDQQKMLEQHCPDNSGRHRLVGTVSAQPSSIGKPLVHTSNHHILTPE